MVKERYDISFVRTDIFLSFRKSIAEFFLEFCLTGVTIAERCAENIQEKRIRMIVFDNFF